MKLSFTIDPPGDGVRCIREEGGGVRAATAHEIAMWDAMSVPAAGEREAQAVTLLELAMHALETCGSGAVEDGGQQWFNDKLVDHAYAEITEFLESRAPARNVEDEWKAPGRYRKRPVVIDAFCLDGGNMPDWFWDKVTTNDVILRAQNTGNPFDNPLTHAEIKTLEGVMRADRGDWIIRGVKGEIYPCKPDIFAATYESASPSTPEKADTVVIRREEVEQLRKDAARWEYVRHHWSNVNISWNKDAANSLKSLVLTIKTNHWTSGAETVEKQIDQAIQEGQPHE